MADEPDIETGSVRRSSRSTKGQNSRLVREAEAEQEAAAVKPPLKKSKKNEDDDSINCPCGVKRDNNGPMIECEQCLKWQHMRCVFQTDDESVVPEPYKCPTCNNNNNKKEENATMEAPKKQKQSKRNNKEQSNSRSSINDLEDKVRKSVADALYRMLAKTIVPEAIKNGTLNKEDIEVDEYSEKISLEIEQALFHQLAMNNKKSNNSDVGSKYRDKFRSISFNLKDSKNFDLRNRVVSRQLPASELVAMSNQDMSNPELQKLAQSVKQESIRESVLKVEEQQGPRIRKTHKGEEYIEEEEEPANTGDDDYYNSSAAAVIPKSDPTSTDYTTNDNNENNSTNETTTNNNDRHHTTMDLGTYSPMGSFAGDDDDDGLNESRININSDDDLDEIVYGDGNDDDGEKRNTTTPLHEIWTGEVVFTGITKLVAKSYHVYSTSSKLTYTDWDQIIDMSQPIAIDGRLDKKRAESYLQTVAPSKPLTVYLIQPDSGNDEDEANYQTLFDYFHSRDKYGVIVKNQGHNVKDAYLIPIGPEDSIPDYLNPSAIESYLSQYRHRNLILGLYVVNSISTNPTAAATNDNPQQPDPSQMLQNLGLSQSDLTLLQSLIQSNPQAAQDPQLLLELLQKQTATGN